MESIRKNFFYQSAYQILTIVLPLLTSPYLARVIGAEGVGIYSYTYAIVNYFVISARLGLHNYGNRCIATVRDDRAKLSQTFCDLYCLHVVVSAVAIIAYIGFIFLYGEEYKKIFIIQGLYLIAQLLDINWFFFGIEKFKITVTRNMFIKLLTVASVFAFVREKQDFIKYIFILAFGSALSESIVWIFVGNYIEFVKPSLRACRKHFFPMTVFFIPSVAVSIYKMMDKIMLGVISNTVQVGLYENSEKIVNICMGFVTALGTVMLPRMTNLMATGRMDESKGAIEKSAKIVLCLSYAMCFGIIGISAVFPIIFWGNEFQQCSYLMMGLAVSLPFTAIANVIRTQYLMPRHHDKAFVLAVCAGAVINLAVNSVCIPQMDAMGAVVGTIMAEILVCLIQLIAAQKEIPIWRYAVESLPFVLFGGIMAVVVYFMGVVLGYRLLTLVLQVCVGGFIYILCSGIYLSTIGKKYLRMDIFSLRKH